MVPVPVYLTDGQPLSEQLAAAASRSAAQGVTIRALLITNPDNPTGRAFVPCFVHATACVYRKWSCSVCFHMRPAGKVYDPAALMEMLQFCCEHGLHYVRCVLQHTLSIGAGPHQLICEPLRQDALSACLASLHNRRSGPLMALTAVLVLRSDEIYANSVFGKADFQSAAQLAASLSPALQAASANLCHVVFGLSKDWCGPQLKVDRCGMDVRKQCSCDRALLRAVHPCTRPAS